MPVPVCKAHNKAGVALLAIKRAPNQCVAISDIVGHLVPLEGDDDRARLLDALGSQG